MKKQKENTNPPKEIKVDNWDQWFDLCQKCTSYLEKYEKELIRYYSSVKFSKNEVEAANNQIMRRHNTNWLKEEEFLSKKAIKTTLTTTVAAFFISFLTLLILSFRKKGAMTIKSVAIYSAIIGIIMMILSIISYRMKVAKVRKNQEKLEPFLKSALTYIPPRFRNKQSVEAFYDLYSAYDVANLTQAIPLVDNYLQENNLLGLYMASFFDLPYQNSKDANGETSLASKNEKDKSNPALPSDIESKTFAGTEGADAKLQNLIGLDNVKMKIMQMKSRMEFHSGANTAPSSNHMVFLGPPGTGKTTIARIVTKILYDYGYIKENRCVEVDGGYMKSPFAGQTPERVSAIIDYAMGGVLFIDEAYVLTQDQNAQEVIGILLKAMEDRRGDFVVIFAGYEDDINRMLATNEGFASRIKHKLYFESFTTEELGEIFKTLLNSTQNRFTIEDSAFDIILKQFDSERKLQSFGNARAVRNALENLIDIHAYRFQKGEIEPDKKFTITEDDAKEYIETRKKQVLEDKRNYIANNNIDSSIISFKELKSKTKEGSENPDNDLYNLIGLDNIKEEMNMLKAQFNFYDGKMENKGNHMLFVGPPGTGKTTVARIITGYLYELGIISENSYLDINGDFLRGMYLGHTGKRTEAVIQYCQGMVLFIDEAYLLSSKDGSSDSFGQEAIGVLLDAMEKYKNNFVVIFAGYEDEMNQFLSVNSGLRSRISTTFHFKNYTPFELAKIFNLQAKSQGFLVEKEVFTILQKEVAKYLNDPHFGNARFIRQVFEKTKQRHIMNFSHGMYEEGKKYVITPQDLEM